MVFEPVVNQEIKIDSVTYRFAEHPAAPRMPYGQEGRYGIVYQLQAAQSGIDRALVGGARSALKVFKARYRVPALAGLAERLAAFAGLPGLRVCERIVLIPQRHGALLRQFPDLTYAVLMPWIEGPTWMQVMLEQRPLTVEQSVAFAYALASMLAQMEQRGVAHCDLSGPNVMMPALAAFGGELAHSTIALVDVEQLYGPGLDRPEFLPSSSPGYAHQTAAGGLWNPTADRFAGAVLLAEMLGWCDPRTRDACYGESYFEAEEMQQLGNRYQVLLAVLRERWGGPTAQLFTRAWESGMLRDCPTFGEWLVTLPEPTAPRAVEAPSAEPTAGISHRRWETEVPPPPVVPPPIREAPPAVEVERTREPTREPEERPKPIVPPPPPMQRQPPEAKREPSPEPPRGPATRPPPLVPPAPAKKRPSGCGAVALGVFLTVVASVVLVWIASSAGWDEGTFYFFLAVIWVIGLILTIRRAIAARKGKG